MLASTEYHLPEPLGERGEAIGGEIAVPFGVELAGGRLPDAAKAIVDQDAAGFLSAGWSKGQEKPMAAPRMAMADANASLSRAGRCGAALRLHGRLESSGRRDQQQEPATRTKKPVIQGDVNKSSAAWPELAMRMLSCSM